MNVASFSVSIEKMFVSFVKQCVVLFIQVLMSAPFQIFATFLVDTIFASSIANDYYCTDDGSCQYTY